MTQEQKELLLTDLCARLAHNPFCKVDGLESPVKLIRIEVDSVDGILLDFDYKDEQGLPLQVYLSEIKPYLRSTISMTEEEKKEFVATKYEEVIKQYPCSADPTEVKVLSYTTKTFDWLNAHHFDCRGLIPMGLAIKVTEKNNPYKD